MDLCANVLFSLDSAAKMHCICYKYLTYPSESELKYTKSGPLYYILKFIFEGVFWFFFLDSLIKSSYGNCMMQNSISHGVFCGYLVVSRWTFTAPDNQPMNSIKLVGMFILRNDLKPCNEPF